MRADGTSRVDDYYSGSAKEPPGRWYVGPAEEGTRFSGLGIVSGAAFVVTENVDDGAAFAALVDGYNPRTGQAMVQNAGKHARIAIHDWTCSAPKSVSVVWSQADAELRAAIDSAQEHGARAFLDVLSLKSYSRRGKDGIVKVAAPLRGAVFDHGSSRDNDPQKHSHCVVFNATERADGTTGALETLELMRWQGAAASIYHATLAWDLRQLGFRIERQENLFEIADVPEHVCQAFSQRRQQIVAAVRAEMVARGLDPETVTWSRGLLQKATTETRSAKNELTREQLLELWHGRGVALGFTAVEAEALLMNEPVPQRSR
jgi:conjugative relaxase-like TrwC/TraI family protein